MNKGKKIKENWARVEIFGICFLLIFYRYCLQFILKGRLGNGFCPRSISRFPNDSFFLKLLVLSHSETCEATVTKRQVALYLWRMKPVLKRSK